jgi:predicted Zn-dependent protease with MMP-like domain
MMERSRFEGLVTRAIHNLPPEFQSRMENVDVMIQNWPTPSQMAEVKAKHPRGLLGLYEGVPQTKRSSNYGMVLPDRITIFQKPIESVCRTQREVEERIQKVVRHEIAHHFGIDDNELAKIGM